MAINKLTWSDSIPNTEKYQKLFTRSNFDNTHLFLFSKNQPRLHYALKQLIKSPVTLFSFLLLKAPEEIDYINIIADAIYQIYPRSDMIFGGKYQITKNIVKFKPATSVDEQFAVKSSIITANWVENEQLFGYLRYFNNTLTIHPGLIHQANGGVLIIPLNTLITQPLMWVRLKSIVTYQRFNWITFDKSYVLPITVPSMPLSIKIVLIGNCNSLTRFQEIEPEFVKTVIYSEFEDNKKITNEQDMTHWCSWVQYIANYNQLSVPSNTAWPVLIQEATRYTEDQEVLPLCPMWLNKQLREVSAINKNQQFTGEQLTQIISQREWRENFLIKRTQEEILLKQILIETEGKRIGQVNALSIIECPGYPRVFGVPSRISCVVHIGDGEFTNIERKVELSSNIHTKGVMIIYAFLMAHLQLEQQIPFSASLTFEQSYSIIDGDSASIAELCVLISALANVPINQEIAITGSVDQFGYVHPVGSLNEKIEGFFTICQQQGLTGKQGVIIPKLNIRHLSLKKELVSAIKNKQFTIWAISNINDALFLLTNSNWDGKEQNTLLKLIKERITNVVQHSTKYQRLSKLLRWLNR